MRSMFGERSPARRRDSISKQQQSQHSVSQHHIQHEQARPLAASAADAASSRRRQMAFMKYGSETKQKKSASSMNRMREHARQITMQFSQDTNDMSPQSVTSASSAYSQHQHTASTSQRRTAFADFSSAFPESDDDEEEDLFAPMKVPLRNSGIAAMSSRNNTRQNQSTSSHSTSTAFADFDSIPAGPSTSFFDQDPVADPFSPRAPVASSSRRAPGSNSRNMEQQQHQQQRGVGFETDWPAKKATSPPQSMSTFPSNSSMQASFVAQTVGTSSGIGMGSGIGSSSTGSGSSHADYDSNSHSHSKLREPVRMVPTTSFASAASTTASGAAARRRMRNQMRKTPSSTDSLSEQLQPLHQQTPPQSPHRARFHSGDSAGSSNGRSSGISKIADHVQHYSVGQQQQQQQAQPQRKTMIQSTTRSVGSGSATRSVESSNDGSDPANTATNNLFDAKVPPGDGGLSFDAFGLDASQFDMDVNLAMQEIAGSHPDLSHFMDPDPADDFAAGRWDTQSSPGASRSSTPTTATNTAHEEEGFVDGFRVTRSASQSQMTTTTGVTGLPLHPTNAHRSPTASTEKSSWTSESGGSERQLPPSASGRNQFKEQAGFAASNNKPRKVIRPPPRLDEGRALSSVSRNKLSPQRSPQRESFVSNNGLNGFSLQQQQHNSNNNSPVVPRMPELEDDFGQQSVHRLQAPVRRQPQQEQQEVEFVDVESDFSGPTQSNSGRAASDFQASSEVGAFSDVALASDVGVSAGFGIFDSDIGEIPMEVTGSSKKKKKNRSDDSVVDIHAGEEKKEEGGGEPTPEKGVGNLRSQWEQRDATVSQIEAQRQLERQQPATPLRRDDIDNLQNQLGHEILSPEKLQKRSQLNEFQRILEPQKQRASECGEQRTSFASLKERLKSPTDRDEREYSASKSEGGASVRHSHVNSVLNKFRAGSPEVESPRDAQSDAGGSPAFGAFKLRKTGFSKEDSPRGNSPAANAGTNHALNDRLQSLSLSSHSRQDTGLEQYHQKEEQREEPQPKKLTYREQRDLEFQMEREEEERRIEQRELELRMEREEEERHIAEQKAIEAKLPYRERRERELRKEREEEERRQAEQKANEASQPDVATLIKRRIAANKQAVTTGTPSSPSRQESIPAFRGNLRPVSAVSVRDSEEVTRGTPSSPGRQANLRPVLAVSEEDRDHSSTGDMKSHSIPRRSEDPSSPRAPYQQRHADLVVEEVGAAKKSITHQNESSGPASAISRMIMLEQLEQRQPRSEHHSKPPPSPVKDSNRMGLSLAIETAPSADSEDGKSKTPKATTPKATMMMLNAFLHGRESISSADGGSTTKPQSEAHQSDAGGSDAVEHNSAAPPAASRIPPAVKDDPQYERYFKMLKIGMPLDVVKHAMVRDGVDPSVMDGDPSKPAGIPLKDDPTYKKYFKMLGFGLPMEAVKHAMERDGLDSTVMDKDHDLPINVPNQSQVQDEPVERDSHRRSRLHWKPLRKVTSNSVWAKIDQEIDDIEIDEEEFQELFQVEKNATAAPAGASATQSKRGSSVRVIDPKRANNGGIILARLKMSHDEMADAVDRINENALSAEQIENIIEYLPTKEERKALESYMLEGGQDAAEKFEGLCECEKFMVSMMTVKHAKRKVRALLFKLQFESCLEDIHNDTVTIESACVELSGSTRLRQLFGFVLTFGNRLNMAGTGGNGSRKAGAFTLDSLLKLNQAKAFDKKTTFLHYLILIVQRNNELLLNFKDDIPTVFKADKVFWDQCLTDLEEVENQLENVRKIALYQARQARIYRVPRKKKHDDDGNESLSEGETSLTLEEEVEALRATPVGLFTLSAIKYVSSLRDRVESTKSKFSRLLEYFGEDDKQPHELFSTMVAFSRDFDNAKEKVFAKQKSELREERKRQAKVAKAPNGKPPTHSPAPPERQMLRASNMQPSMSSVLAEMKTRPPAIEAKPVLSPVREIVGPESPSSSSSDRYYDAPAQQNSYSNPSHRSPQPSNRYNNEAVQQSSYSNPIATSPRSSNRYNDASAQQSSYSNPADTTSPRSSNRYNYESPAATPQRFVDRNNDESVQENSFLSPAAQIRRPNSTQCNDEAPAATPQRSVDKELMTPDRTPSSVNAPGQSMQAPYTTGRMDIETNGSGAASAALPAPAATPSRTAIAMRHKARLRRQRFSQSTSPATSESSPQADPIPIQQAKSPARSDSVGLDNSNSSRNNIRRQRFSQSASSPATSEASPQADRIPIQRAKSPARSDSVGLDNSNSSRNSFSQQQAPVPPARTEMYSRSNSENDDGACKPEMSPRANFRHKRRAQQRQQAMGKGSDSSSAPSEQHYEI